MVEVKGIKQTPKGTRVEAATPVMNVVDKPPSEKMGLASQRNKNRWSDMDPIEDWQGSKGSLYPVGR